MTTWAPFLSRDAMLTALWRKIRALEDRVALLERPGQGKPKGGKN